jgi:TetR/AcrR family transcriptional repressor of nem operon
MRVSREEMAKSHDRILSGAAQLLRERGLEGASVADVMTQAGLTHGGFYRHFATKEALVDAALQAAFVQSASIANAPAAHGAVSDDLAGYRSYYLSSDHLANPGMGCPIAALGGDLARASPVLRQVFGAGVRLVVKQLTRFMPRSQRTDDERQDAAMREIAMLAGAVMIARASDPETARAVLRACARGSDGV